MRKTIISLLCVFCLGISLFLSKSLWLNRIVTVSFDVINEKAFQAQIFYTQKDGEIFNQIQSVKKAIDLGKQHVNINLPILFLKKFRIDFGNTPGYVEISNLKLNGKEIKSLSFSDFNPNNQISTYTPKGNTAIVISNMGGSVYRIKKIC